MCFWNTRNWGDFECEGKRGIGGRKDVEESTGDRMTNLEKLEMIMIMKL